MPIPPLLKYNISPVSFKPPKNLLYLAGILFFGILAYANSLHNSFHFDDTPAIVNNPAIRSLGNLGAIWSFAPCRFIVILSFVLNYQVSQLNVLGYHLFNLFTHLANGCLVFWFIRLTFSTPAIKGQDIAKYAGLIAFIGGLVFTLHPVQSQAVNYIYQRAASLATLFYLASVCFYVKCLLLNEEGQSRAARTAFYALSLFFALAAVFTKEMTITLPAMLCLYELSFFNRAKLNWKFLAPFFLISLIIPATLLLTGSAPFAQIYSNQAPKWHITYWQYALTQIRAMFTYIRLLFLPLYQRLDYDYPVYSSIFNLPVLLSLVSLGAIAYFIRKIWRNYRLAAFGLIWFFLAILPESSFMPLPDIILEHRLYLPMAGFSLFLTAGLYYLFGEKRIKLMVIAVCVILSIFSLLTYQRNRVWRSNLTLWTDAVHKFPNKARPYYNRGNAYYDRGEFFPALLDYDRAIAIDPTNIQAYHNRALAYRRLGMFQRALDDLDLAVKIKPGYAKGYFSRAFVYYSMKEYFKSQEDLLKARSLGFNSRAGFVEQLKKHLDEKK